MSPYNLSTASTAPKELFCCGISPVRLEASVALDSSTRAVVHDYLLFR
jgi:hypothetical protein